jgi:tetratricopeptide (TPR) repeat protein
MTKETEKRLRQRLRPRASLKQKANKYLSASRKAFVGQVVNGKLQANLHEALTKARQGLMLDPSNYELLILAGDIVSESEEDSPDGLRNALEYYARAISLHPKEADAYLSKALTLHGAGRANLAVIEARQALRLMKASNPTDVRGIELAYTTLIDILVDLHRFTEVRATIRSALKHVPTKFMREMAQRAQTVITI